MLSFKSSSKSVSNIINKSWFWWTIFVVDLNLSFLFMSLAKTLISSGLLTKEWAFSLLSLVVIQFVFVFFAIPKVTTNTDLYGHWRGREVAQKIKRETETHQELDSLRDAMIFGDEGGEQYWSVILQLTSDES